MDLGSSSVEVKAVAKDALNKSEWVQYHWYQKLGGHTIVPSPVINSIMG